MVEEQEFGILVSWASGKGGSGNILGVVVSFEFSHDFNDRGSGVFDSGRSLVQEFFLAFLSSISRGRGWDS